MSTHTHNAFIVRKSRQHSQPVWELVTADGQPVEEAERFIHTLVLRGLSPRTRRTYAYDLLAAYRWMDEADRQPEQLAGEDLVAFIDYLRRPPPAAPSTITRRLRLLQRFPLRDPPAQGRPRQELHPQGLPPPSPGARGPRVPARLPVLRRAQAQVLIRAQT